MSNKEMVDNNASASPEPLTLRGLLRSWLEEEAPKQNTESGRRCPS